MLSANSTLFVDAATNPVHICKTGALAGLYVRIREAYLLSLAR